MDGFRIEDLRFSYKDQPVLRGINLEIEPGVFTGILGPNGSGKTTLLRILSGDLTPQSGRVRLGQDDVRRLSEKQRARRIAVVPQRSDLAFDFTVMDVVLMGRYPYIPRFSTEDEEDYRIARESMALTGIAHLENRGVQGLSGGEWQRVTIARALAQQTDTLLLDEPVNSLDIRHQVEVLGAMRALCREQGKTVVCVLHDLNLAAQYCARLALFCEGTLRATGAPDAVLDPDILGAVYGVPVEVMAHPRTGVRMVLPMAVAEAV